MILRSFHGLRSETVSLAPADPAISKLHRRPSHDSPAAGMGSNNNSNNSGSEECRMTRKRGLLIRIVGQSRSCTAQALNICSLTRAGSPTRENT